MLWRRFSPVFLAIAALTTAARSAVGAESYVIIDDRTGYVLESKEPKQKRQVGSLTKVATACVVLDWAEHNGGDLNQLVGIPQASYVGIKENNIGFSPGDAITLRDLMYAALVQSDNIAAFTLAAHVGSKITPAKGGGKKLGPIDVFVGQMNALARQL